MMPELGIAPALPRDITYASFDDLKLHVRHYPAPDEKARSVICLPGLTRNARDFNQLATYLSTHPQKPRNVYCVDYRGRGLSQYDRNWRNYIPFIELIDVLDFLTVQGLHRVGIVGTSRGGIIAMLMAALRPTAMGPVVLNDIGPVIETRGLARIMGYVGRMPVPKSWPDAVSILREMNERAFPEFSDAQWDEMAHDVFDERKGRPALAYDRRLARALGTIDLSRSVPDLWPQFIAPRPGPGVRDQGRQLRRAQRRYAGSHDRAPSQFAQHDRPGSGPRAGAQGARRDRGYQLLLRRQ